MNVKEEILAVAEEMNARYFALMQATKTASGNPPKSTSALALREQAYQMQRWANRLVVFAREIR